MINRSLSYIYKTMLSYCLKWEKTQKLERLKTEE